MSCRLTSYPLHICLFVHYSFGHELVCFTFDLASSKTQLLVHDQWINKEKKLKCVSLYIR